MSIEEPADDVELLRTLAKSPRAFETFYRRHVSDITRYLARRCRTPEDVADGVSATFLAVLTSAERFDPERGTPFAWLYSIARNEARGQSRSAGRREALRVRLQGSALLSQEDTDRIAELIDYERAAARLNVALSTAPANELELLDRVVANDENATEAARSLGISPSAGRKRLERLRGRVTDAIDGPLTLDHWNDSSMEEK
jgi:RNA polymerase sigma-70 factor (ECF subfamily)